MNKCKVIFRADGSAKIGFGHVYRTLALVHMVHHEFDCTYVSHDAPEFLVKALNALNIPFIQVNTIDYSTPDERKLGEEVPFDMGHLLEGNEIVVTDGYWFGTKFQKAIKEIGCKLACIDDLYNEEFLADLIINHASCVEEKDYNAQSYTQFALGFKYALLRPAFLEQAKTTRNIEKIETVFICFGGSDLLNYTEKVLAIVSTYKCFKRIIVISGEAYLHRDSLLKYKNDDKRIFYLHSANDEEMIRLMLESDLAIVPASGILMEALAVGLNVISGIISENQKRIFDDYKKGNAFVSAELFSNEDINRAILTTLKNTNKLLHFFDGLSPNRILEKFLDLLLSIRLVKQEDSKLIFNWANSVDVRANSVQKGAIKWADHLKWFNRRLNSDDVKMFILEEQGVPIGQIRYELEGDHWLIGYSIDEQSRGKGFGKKIIKMTLPYFDGSKIKALVKKNNIFSVKVFEGLNFKLQDEINIENELFLIFEI